MAMVFVATVAWSFAGLFTRSLTMDVCTTVTWRSFAGGLVLLVPWLVRRRSSALRDLVSLSGADWIAILVGAVAQAATTAGLFLTSVAHVAVIYAACPFIAALLAWCWLGERMGTSTVVAILGSAAGVGIVVAGSISGASLAGDVVALVMTTAFALLIVLPKVYPDLRVVETMIVGAFITFALFLPFSHIGELDLRNGVLVGAYGAINLVLAYFVFIQGARSIPAATAGLIATLEIVLSPLWVWLVFGETVDASTLMGGIVVCGSVVGHLVFPMSRGPADRGAGTPHPSPETGFGRSQNQVGAKRA